MVLLPLKQPGATSRWLDFAPLGPILVCRLAISDDTAVKDELSEIMIEAMRIETASKSRDAETIAMFRFNDEERSRYRDGIGLAETGMSGLKCGQSTYPLDAARP